MTFNDDGSLRCNLCNSDPCVCGKSRDPSREAFEASMPFKVHCCLVPERAEWLAECGDYNDYATSQMWSSWQAALAWKAAQEKPVRKALRRIVRKDGAVDVTDAAINHARRILGDKANGNG